MANENIIEMMVDGQRVVLDVDLDTSITNLNSDMDTIATLLGWYGRLYAAAERAAANADTKYRFWRATLGQQIITRDPKTPEYRIRMFIEGSPGFIQHKEHIEACEELATRLQRALVALEKKSDTLRSRGANARAELAATGMTTVASPAGRDTGSADSLPRDGGPSKHDRDEAIKSMDLGSARRRRRPSIPRNSDEGE